MPWVLQVHGMHAVRCMVAKYKYIYVNIFIYYLYINICVYIYINWLGKVGQMLHFLCTGACVRACTWLVKSWIPHCTDESMMGNCSHVVFQKNKIYQHIFNPLARNNVERIRDHPCPLMTPVLTRRLQAPPAQRWSAAILKVEGASIDTSRPEISN